MRGKDDVDLPLIGVVYALQRDIFFIFKQTIEFGPQAVKSEFRQDELYIGLY